MSEKIIDLGNGFYNIRGNFHVGGVLNIGTQCSLIQLDNKRFLCTRQKNHPHPIFIGLGVKKLTNCRNTVLSLLKNTK